MIVNYIYAGLLLTGAMPADLPCPICDAQESSDGQLRRHLMVEHRKSDLTALLVTDVSDSREEPLTV